MNTARRHLHTLAGMERKDWLALCAVHSDAWLMSLAFFYAARFDADGRAELFSYVNQHPTIYEARREGLHSRAAAQGHGVASGSAAVRRAALHPPPTPLCCLPRGAPQVVTGRVARNKMYKRKVPKQQTAAAHAAVQSQAAALAAFDEPNSFVRPGYQAADQVRSLQSLAAAWPPPLVPCRRAGQPGGAAASGGWRGAAGRAAAAGVEALQRRRRMPDLDPRPPSPPLPRSRCPRAGC